MQPDLYSSDDKDEYISLDAFLDVTVFVTQPSQNKESDTPVKKPIKQILHKGIQKENSYAIPKNVRFGKWRQVENIQPPLMPTPLQKPS